MSPTYIWSASSPRWHTLQQPVACGNGQIHHRSVRWFCKLYPPAIKHGNRKSSICGGFIYLENHWFSGPVSGTPCLKPEGKNRQKNMKHHEKPSFSYAIPWFSIVFFVGAYQNFQVVACRSYQGLSRRRFSVTELHPRQLWTQPTRPRAPSWLKQPLRPGRKSPPWNFEGERNKQYIYIYVFIYNILNLSDI